MAHTAMLSVFFFKPALVSEFFILFFEPILVSDFFKRALLLKVFPNLLVLLKVFLGPAPFLNPMTDWSSIVTNIGFHFVDQRIVNRTTCKRNSWSLFDGLFLDQREGIGFLQSFAFSIGI